MSYYAPSTHGYGLPGTSLVSEEGITGIRHLRSAYPSGLRAALRGSSRAAARENPPSPGQVSPMFEQRSRTSVETIPFPTYIDPLVHGYQSEEMFAHSSFPAASGFGAHGSMAMNPGLPMGQGYAAPLPAPNAYGSYPTFPSQPHQPQAVQWHYDEPRVPISQEYEYPSPTNMGIQGIHHPGPWSAPAPTPPPPQTTYFDEQMPVDEDEEEEEEEEDYSRFDQPPHLRPIVSANSQSARENEQLSRLAAQYTSTLPTSRGWAVFPVASPQTATPRRETSSRRAPNIATPTPVPRTPRPGPSRSRTSRAHTPRTGRTPHLNTPHAGGSRATGSRVMSRVSPAAVADSPTQQPPRRRGRGRPKGRNVRGNRPQLSELAAQEAPSRPNTRSRSTRQAARRGGGGQARQNVPLDPQMQQTQSGPSSPPARTLTTRLRAREAARAAGQEMEDPPSPEPIPQKRDGPSGSSGSKM